MMIEMKTLPMNSDERFTPTEIIMATGIGRGSISDRALRLGLSRDGKGYTLEEVYKIIAYVPNRRKAAQDKAERLRNRLTDMLKTDNSPVSIEKNEKGEWSVEIRE